MEGDEVQRGGENWWGALEGFKFGEGRASRGEIP